MANNFEDIKNQMLEDLGITSSESDIDKIKEKLGDAYEEQVAAGEAWAKSLKEQLRLMDGSGKKFGRFNALMDESSEKYIDAVEDVADGLSRAANVALKSASKLTIAVTGGATFFKGMAKGVLADEMSYLRGMREIAYVSEGITGETENLQNAWQEVGKTARITGKNITVFQKQYMKNLKQGYRVQAETLDVTKTGLHVSTMIGASAEGTADLFNTWHMQLGRGSDEIAEMGRGMRIVARETGVMGDNLIEVAKSSEKIMNRLRSIGSLTADSTKNLTSVLAEAKKAGVESTTNQIMGALAGGTSARDSGINPLTVQSANRAGLSMEDIWSGDILDDKKKLKGFAEGMKSMVGDILPFMQDVSTEALKELTGSQKMAADTIIKNSLGVEGGVGELILSLEAMEKGSQDFAEKANLLQIELAKGTLTTQEFASKQRILSDLMIGEQQTLAGAVLQASKEAGGFEMAIQSALSNEKYASSLEKLNLDQLKGAEQVRAVLQGAANGINEQLSDAGVSGLSISADSIEKALSDPKQYELLLKNMDEAQKAAAVAEKASTDPMSKIEHWTNLTNEAIRDFSSGAFQWYSKIFGALGILTTQAVASGVMGGIGAANIFEFPAKVRLLGDMEVPPNFAKSMGLDKIMGDGSGGMMKVGDALTSKSGILVSNILKSAGGGVKVLANSLKDIPIVGKTAATAMFSLGGGITGLSTAGLSAIAPIAGAAAAIVALGGGIVSAITAGENAASIFNTSLEKVTLSQRWAAEGAGLLTGILNTLTFGIFRKALGPTGTLTQTMAKFFEQFPMFSIALQPFIMQFKILWGTLKGLYSLVIEVFQGIWKGVQAILTPIADAINAVIDPIQKAFASFIGAGGGALSIIDLISGSFKFLGKVIGGLFTVIGEVAGFMVKILVPAFSAIGTVLGFVASMAVSVLQPLWVGFQKIGDAIGGLLSLIGMGPVKKISNTSTLSGPTGDGAFPSSSKEAENLLPKAEKSFYEHGTKKGSIYTHDIHTEALLKSILRKMDGGSSGGGGKKGSAGSRFGSIAAGTIGMAVDINGILMSAGSIAASVVAAGAALSIFPAVAPLIPLMAIGGAVLISMVPAIVGLAVGVVKISDLISEAFDVDAQSAVATANNVAGIINAAGMIGLMTIGAAPGLIAMNALPALIPFIVSGGLILMLLSGSIVALAAGVTAISQAIIQETGLDAKESAQVAHDVAGLLHAAGMIGMMSLGAGLAMSSMLLLTPLIPFMVAGGAVLIAMSSAVVALTAGVVAISQGIVGVTGLDAKESSKVAHDVANLLHAAGKIGILSFGAGVGMTFMPALLPLIPFMIIGGTVLIAMSSAVVALTAGVVAIARGIMGATGLDAKSANEVAENVAGIISSAASIAKNTLYAGVGLSLMGALLPLIPFIVIGGTVLGLLSGSVIALASSIILIGQGVMGLTGMTAETGAKIADGVAGVIESAGRISSAILNMIPFLSGMALLLPIAPLVNMAMLAGAASMAIITPAVVAFAAVMGIAATAINKAFNLKQGAEALDKFQQIGGLFEATADLIETLNERLVPLTQSWWPFSNSALKDVKKMIPEFQLFIPTLISFVKTGIIDPIQKNLVYTKKGEGTLEKLNLLATVFDMISPMLETMTNSIAPLLKKGWLSKAPIDQIAEREEDLIKYFKSISKLILKGIIEPVSQFEWRDEGTLSKLKQIPGVIGAIPPVLDSISAELMPLIKSTWFGWGNSALEEAASLDFSSFNKLLTMINNQIIKPVQANFDIKEGSSVTGLFSDLQGVFEVLSDKSFFQVMQSASYNLSKAKISIIPASVIAGVRSLGKLLTELKLMTKDLPSASELESLTRLMPMVPQYMNKLNGASVNSETTQLSYAENPTGTLYSEYDKKASIEKSRIAKSSSLVDVGDKMQATFASEEPPAGASANANLLAKIFAETALQSELLREGNSYLRTIAAANSDSGSVGGGSLKKGSTSTNSRPPMSRLNSKWPTVFQQSSMAQVVNSGGNGGQG